MKMPLLPVPMIPTEDIVILSYYTPDQMYEYGSKCIGQTTKELFEYCMDINPIVATHLMSYVKAKRLQE